MDRLYPNPIAFINGSDPDLSADNLNEMSRALGEVDKRAAQLGDYVPVVEMARAEVLIAYEETKKSETNAEKSAQRAEEYAEKAFAGTPAGYNQLVDTVSAHTSQLSEVKASLTNLGCNNLAQKNYSVTSWSAYGVTFTQNADGTFVVNGTSTQSFWLQITAKFKLSGQYKMVGCPSGGSSSTFRLILSDQSVSDVGSGAVVSLDGTEKYIALQCLKAGVVFNNVVFKPMITTEMSATYSDYVPYTGEKTKAFEMLSGIKSDISGINANLGSINVALGNKVAGQQVFWQNLASQKLVDYVKNLSAGIYFGNSWTPMVDFPSTSGDNYMLVVFVADVINYRKAILMTGTHMWLGHFTNSSATTWTQIK